MLIKALLQRLRTPPLIGFILLGLALNLADRRWELLDPVSHEVLAFFGDIGVVMLLFRVGLTADLPKLRAQLGRASVIWFWTVLLSGALGFIVSSWLLGFALVPSLLIATALTATSVGVAVGLWHEAGALHSDLGALLIDVAELDDISAVVTMALVLTLAPIIAAGTNGALLGAAAAAIGWFLIKGFLFAAGCILFSRFAEKRLTKALERLERAPDPMLSVAGIGMIVAALAAILGFSLAIGAFFAGLVFSRDPRAVRMETSYETLYELFAPFFFLAIGLALEPSVLGAALLPGALLLVVAVIGKVAGAALPLPSLSRSDGVLLGLSMVPRAEIALIIVQRGQQLGDWALPPEAFAATTLIVMATCLGTPPLLRPMLLGRVREAGD
jgi:Kef-type K+ transport system membrane component KefB